MAVAAREGERGARRSLSLRFVVLPLSIVAAAAAIVFAAPYLYAERALPGVTVAGVDVGSLQAAAIRDRIDGKLSRPWAERAVVAAYDGLSWRTTNGARPHDCGCEHRRAARATALPQRRPRDRLGRRRCSVDGALRLDGAEPGPQARARARAAGP